MAVFVVWGLGLPGTPEPGPLGDSGIGLHGGLMAHVLAAARYAEAQSLASSHVFSAASTREAMPWRKYEVRHCEGGRHTGYVYEDSDGDEIESKDRVLWGVPYQRDRKKKKEKKRHATGADDAGCEEHRNHPEVGEPECSRRPNVEVFQPARQQIRQQLLEQLGCEGAQDERHATRAADAGCEDPRNDPEDGEPESIRRPNGQIQPTRQQLRQQLLEQLGCEVPWNDPEFGHPEGIRRCIGETQPITRQQLRQQRLEQQRQRLNLAGLM